MSDNGKKSLHSLLFEGGRELVNLKLFPGTGRLSAGQLAEAAARSLRNVMKAWENKVPSKAPETGQAKRTLTG